MNTPKKVTVQEEPEGAVFIYRWQDWGFIIIIPVGLFFAVFPVWMGLSIPDKPPLFFWLFLLLFSGIGLGITYWSLGRVINYSEIRLQNGVLSVRHKPLPWRYQANLPVGEIQAVSQETYYNSDRSTHARHGFGTRAGFGVRFQGSFRNERLTAYTQDGKAHILIPKMELAAAQFLEQEIETRLRLRQAQTVVEQEMALQFSQQEQKRVEASQTRMLFPILLLSIPLLLVGGVWLLISTFKAQQEARASLSWPSAEARLADYRIGTTRVTHDDRPDDIYYNPILIYKYTAGGNTYQIEKDVYGRYLTERDVRAQFSKYPLGTMLTVYYNPQKPARALYDRSGPGITPYIIAGVCLAMIPLALLILIMSAREICRAEGCPDDWKHLPFWRKQVPILGRIG